MKVFEVRFVRFPGDDEKSEHFVARSIQEVFDYVMSYCERDGYECTVVEQLFDAQHLATGVEDTDAVEMLETGRDRLIKPQSEME